MALSLSMRQVVAIATCENDKFASSNNAAYSNTEVLPLLIAAACDVPVPTTVALPSPETYDQTSVVPSAAFVFGACSLRSCRPN